MTRDLIEAYAAGAREPERWTAGLSPSDLNAAPIPGKWSVQQCVLHVLDSDLIASHRMKRIIAEDNPLLIAYDETRFAAMRFATTRITDFELRPWLGSYRDFRRYLRRLAALDTMGKDRFLALLGLR